MKRYEKLEEALCKELDKLDKKYSGETEMTQQDVERADTLYHALKCAETYHAMKDADEWGDGMEGSGRGYSYGSGRSYRRGRDAMGRYVSRDMDGYSGHYPEWMPPVYPRY